MKIILAAAASIATFGVATASATVLAFDQSAPNTSTTATPTAIDQGYGDRASGPEQDGYTYRVFTEDEAQLGGSGVMDGFTPNVVVDYISSDPVVSSGFGGLTNVLYERTPGEGLVIRFTADEGFSVRLLGFDVARNEEAATLGVSATLSDERGIILSGEASLFADLGAEAFAGQELTLRIAFDAFVGGALFAIDNVRFEQAGEDGAFVIPLPAAAWLFGAGIAGIAAARRRG